MMTLFSNSMAQSLIPAFSRLFASGQRILVQNLFYRSVRINLIIFLPTMAALIVVAKPFFRIWAGEEFAYYSSPPFYVLAVGLILNFSATVTGAVLVAAQKTKASAILYWLEMAPYLFLAGLFTYFWGAIGAAIAWSLRVVIESILLIIIMNRLVGLKFEFNHSRLSLVLLSVWPLGVAPSLAILGMFGTITLLTILFVGFLIYCFLIWNLVTTEEEKRFFLSKIRSLTPLN